MENIPQNKYGFPFLPSLGVSPSVVELSMECGDAVYGHRVLLSKRSK